MCTALGSDSAAAYEHGGHTCKAKVSTWHQDVMVKIMGKLRACAVRQGALSWLWCEEDMCKPLPQDAKMPRADPALMTCSRKARAAAKEAFVAPSSCEIKNFMVVKSKLALGVDTWRQVA